MISRAGFVAVVGRSNAGKSTLLNALLGENLAIVSHKINATRNRIELIVPYTNKQNEQCQIVFVDTPGIHKREKLLNQFMLESALRAMRDCDLCVFVGAAMDKILHYEQFLDLYKKPHILVLNKIDNINKDQQLLELKKYQPFSKHFLSLIPLSAKKNKNLNMLLEEISKHLPHSSALFSEEEITTHTLRQLSKEAILEAMFEYLSDEIPYQSDVIVVSFKQSYKSCKILANLYVKKYSQKIIVIGKNASNIKRISIYARHKIENIVAQNVFLRINVVVDSQWAKNKTNLKKFGYNFGE